MTTPEIFAYIQGVTVYVALVEAKAEEELTERIVARLRGHDLVPATLRYTENDGGEDEGQETE